MGLRLCTDHRRPRSQFFQLPQNTTVFAQNNSVNKLNKTVKVKTVKLQIDGI